MKKKYLGVLVALMATGFFSLNGFEVDGAGARSYKNTNFTAVSVSSGMKLEVKQGEKYEVTVRTTASMFERLRVEQFGKQLKFYLTAFTIPTARIEIFITMPELTELDLSGGSYANVTMKITDKTFWAGLSGGSQLAGSLQAKRLELGLSGGSQSYLTGEADTMKVEASGGSQIRQENFPVNQASFALSGGCQLTVFVKEQLDIDASGGSQVYYHGSPRLGRNNCSGGSGAYKTN